MATLPTEASFNSSAGSNVTSSPAQTSIFKNSRVSDDAPPSYTGPPSLPSRQPSAPPAKPEIERAVALYRYDDPNDCTFEAGDHISVFEHMNAEWWLGKNTRTGKEGVFPAAYVQVQAAPSSSPYGNEKANGYGGYSSQYQPPAPAPSNPYNSSVPPMAVAAQVRVPSSRSATSICSSNTSFQTCLPSPNSIASYKSLY